MARIALCALAAAAPLWVAAASAETCQEQIERFARQYDLAIDAPQARLKEGDPVTPPAPPMTAESRGLSASDKLKDSGGVIQPPDTGAARVIPPPPTGDRMATAPDVKPQTRSGQGQGAGNSQTLAAADRMKLEALVMAGREAGKRGQDLECMARLGEARAIAEPKAR